MRDTLARYRFAPLYALGASVALFVLVTPFKDGRMGHFYSILHERGPMPYLVVICAFYVSSMAIVAGLRRDYRNSLVFGLFAFAFLPVLLGLIGTLLGIITIFLMAASPAAPDGYQAWAYAAMSLDCLFLGLLTTALNFPIIFRLCVADRGAASEAEQPPSTGAAGRADGRDDGRDDG